MNNKLPRLVLMGLGTFAVVALSAFAANDLRGSSAAAGDEVSQSNPHPRPATPPASAVRG